MEKIAAGLRALANARTESKIYQSVQKLMKKQLHMYKYNMDGSFQWNNVFRTKKKKNSQ